jgi:hypothetical protein
MIMNISKQRVTLLLVALIALLCFSNGAIGQPVKIKGKKIYIPEDLKNNDFQSDTSQWSYHRMALSKNVVVFWQPAFGQEPSTTADEAMRFDVKDLLAKAENIYAYYRDTLKFIGKGSKLDTYRLMIFVIYQPGWMATGSGYDNMVGSLWVYPSTLHPVGEVIAHELGHCFQYQVACDGNYGFRDQDYVGTFWEQCAQYMSRQLYPDANLFNMNFFIDNSYRNFSNEEFRYESFYLQEYWKDRFGKDFLGRVWRQAVVPEHPLQAYMRIRGISQSQLNDEMADYAMHNVIWDYKSGSYMRAAAAKLNTQHHTKLNVVDNDGTLEVDTSQTPECYGYNAFQLSLPAVGTQVSVKFHGIANGYDTLCGWRYGFVGVKSDGKSAVYGTLGRDADGNLSFTIPEGLSALWFVVTGAPQTHYNHVWGTPQDKIPTFPYQVKFVNTNPL